MDLGRAAVAAVDETADPVRAGVLRSKLALYLWTTGQTQASVAEYQAAVELVPAEPPSVERARVLGGLAATLPAAGRYRESREITEEALATLRAAGSHEGEPRLLNLLGMDLVGLGDIDAGLDHLRVAVRIARETGALESQIGAQHNLAFFLSQTDRFEEGLGSRWMASRRPTGWASNGATAPGSGRAPGDILMRSGRWDEAEVMTAEGRDGGEDMSGAIYLRATRVMFLTARGETDAAAEELAGAQELATGDIDPDVQAYLLQAIAEAALHDGRPADALRAVEEALAEFAGSDEVLLVAPLLVVGMAAAADLADHGRAFRDPGAVAAAQAAAEGLLEQAANARRRRPVGATPTPSVRGRNRDRRSRADAARRPLRCGRLGRAALPGTRCRCRSRRPVPAPAPARPSCSPAARATRRAQLLREAHAAAAGLGAVPLRTAIEAIATRSRIVVDAPRRPRRSRPRISR